MQAVRRDAAVEINARATIEASYDVPWGTLTDYDRLAELIPGMRVSRVERRGNEAIVEQLGEVKFLFFRFPIEVTLGSASRPPHVIGVRVLRGNSQAARWRIPHRRAAKVESCCEGAD